MGNQQDLIVLQILQQTRNFWVIFRIPSVSSEQVEIVIIEVFLRILIADPAHSQIAEVVRIPLIQTAQPHIVEVVGVPGTQVRSGHLITQVIESHPTEVIIG